MAAPSVSIRTDGRPNGRRSTPTDRSAAPHPSVSRAGRRHPLPDAIDSPGTAAPSGPSAVAEPTGGCRTLPRGPDVERRLPRLASNSVRAGIRARFVEPESRTVAKPGVDRVYREYLHRCGLRSRIDPVSDSKLAKKRRIRTKIRERPARKGGGRVALPSRGARGQSQSRSSSAPAVRRRRTGPHAPAPVVRALFHSKRGGGRGRVVEPNRGINDSFRVYGRATVRPPEAPSLGLDGVSTRNGGVAHRARSAENGARRFRVNWSQ